MNFANCNLGNTFLAKFVNNALVFANVVLDYSLAYCRVDLLFRRVCKMMSRIFQVVLAA